MVLSLGFILALVGAGVGLLVGILIFGEVSDAIECPASEIIGGGGEGNLATNDGTLGSSADGTYFENDIETDFQIVTGILNNGVLQEGQELGDSNGEIRFGTNSQWNFFHTPTGSALMSINIWLKGDFETGGNDDETSLISTMTFPDNCEISCSNNGIFLYIDHDSGSGSHKVKGDIRENGADIESSNWGVLIPEDGQWHMLTIAIDYSADEDNPPFPRKIIPCVDAVCLTERLDNDFAGGAGNSYRPMTIGSQDSAGGGFNDITFEVDDFTIWHGYNLTQSDIDTLYNGGLGSSAGSSGSNIEPSFQVLHVTFDSFGTGGGGASGETGSEQCEQAKQTAWTVIGIMPVALFFGLFVLFSSFQRPS